MLNDGDPMNMVWLSIIVIFAKNIHQSNSNSNVDMKMQPQNLSDRVIEGLTV